MDGQVNMNADLPQTTSLKMNYEEFLVWTDEDTHAEWSKGEVIIKMPPKLVHQLLVDFIYKIISYYVDLFDLGTVITAPFEVKLTPQGSAREPDLFFVATANNSRLTEARLVGAPDLVIEVVSGSSVKSDRDDKFREYEAVGVSEYWIIDPRTDKQRADFYCLDDHGIYRLFATEDDEKAISTVLKGFWLKPSWLWRAETIKPLHCLLQIEGVMDALSQEINQMQNKIIR